MLQIKPCEYKVMLDPGFFHKEAKALKTLWKRIQRACDMYGCCTGGEFDSDERRTIQFLDTVGYALSKRDLILRRRKNDGKSKAGYTLKCRTVDLYITQGTDVRARKGLQRKRRFESDVAKSFRSRYSHSETIKLEGEGDQHFETMSEAGALFPHLNDSATSDGSTSLRVVRGFIASEKVLKGPNMVIPGNMVATLALILWSEGLKWKPVVSEFSFSIGMRVPKRSIYLRRPWLRSIYSMPSKSSTCLTSKE